MKRLFAISVDDVKAAEETLQQKGLERHWTGGGTLNCVLQNKMYKLETQKKKNYKTHLRLRKVPLSKEVESRWMPRVLFSYFQDTLDGQSENETTSLTKIFGRYK